MPETSQLDALLGVEEAHATFHDAELLSVVVNYEKRELVSEWYLCVGDPDASDRGARNRQRRGRLTLQKPQFWVVEPPASAGRQPGLPWLTSDGPLRQAPTETGRRLADQLRPGSMGWYLYLSGWNAYVYCGAAGARFQWE